VQNAFSINNGDWSWRSDCYWGIDWIYVSHISQKYNNAILGFAAGVMLAAAVIGLIIPSAEMTGRSGIWMTVLGIFFGRYF